jgi:L-amino acid N-acyltransferase YncA
VGPLLNRDTRFPRGSYAEPSSAPPMNEPIPGCQLTINALVRADWPAVAEIYRQGIETGDATFETEVPSWDDWDAAHLPQRIVARLGRDVVGWAALAPMSDRSVYRGVAWDSVYVERGAQGRGLGRLLLERLIRDAEAAGIWTLQAGVFPENRASLVLHERCGFRVVGVRERLARHEGRWRDVVLLERRSRVVG